MVDNERLTPEPVESVLFWSCRQLKSAGAASVAVVDVVVIVVWLSVRRGVVTSASSVATTVAANEVRLRSLFVYY